MQYSFQQKALKEIEKTAEKLKNLGYSVTLPIKKLYNYEIDIDTHKNRVKFLIYFGKKGLKKILQGDSDSKFYKEIKKHLFDDELFDSASNEIEEFDDYVGTDESGKGDYFGPLVIAGVYINKNDSTELLKLGVKDSKLLSDYQIKNMSKQLLEVVKNNYDIVIIKPEKYNQLYSSFGNLNKLLAWGHSKVIENLKSKINFSNVICDKFGDENLILNELRKKEIEINLIQTPKAERFIAVAAASILARAKVIEWFERASRELGIDLIKGASDKVDKIAKSVLEQTSEENLKKLVKFHFKNSKSIKK
jgi:ribonuclease HIII